MIVYDYITLNQKQKSYALHISICIECICTLYYIIYIHIYIINLAELTIEQIN